MIGVLSRHDCPAQEGSWLRGGAAALAVWLLAASFCAHPASAETLDEALSNAYLINPVLNAERAQPPRDRRAGRRSPNPACAQHQCFRRCGVPQHGSRHRRRQPTTEAGLQRCDARPARSSLASAPRSTLSSDLRPDGGSSGDGVTHPRGYSVQLSQPIFEGFQNINAIRQAKASVQAGARSLARHRADDAAQCRHRLCRRRARPGGGALARVERRGAERAAAPDQGPLQCRRSDAHRRGPGRGAPVRCASRSFTPRRPT